MKLKRVEEWPTAGKNNIEEVIKNKKYIITVEMGRKPGRKRIRRTFYGKGKDAEVFKIQLQAQVKAGTYVEPSDLTVGEYLEQWLADCENLSPLTLRRYKQVANLRLIPFMGMIPIEKLRPLHIKECYQKIAEEGSLKPKKDEKGKPVFTPLSQESLNYHRKVLRKSLNDAIALEIITTNPAAAIKVPKSQLTPDMDLDDDEAADCSEYVRCLDGDQTNFLLDILYDSTTDKKARKHQNKYFWYALVYTDLWTGLRRGELLALRWGDIDFAKRTLSVRRSLAYTKEKGIFVKKPKNKKSARTIEITPETIEVLKEFKKEQTEMRLFLDKEYHDHDLVFCQDDGQPLHPDTPSKWFPKYLAKCGLAPLNFHCLRHSHASLLINAGAEPKTISERLGHSSIRVTYDVYGHLFAGRQTEALEKMSDLLKDKKAQKRHKNEKGSQD